MSLSMNGRLNLHWDNRVKLIISQYMLPFYIVLRY